MKIYRKLLLALLIFPLLQIGISAKANTITPMSIEIDMVWTDALGNPITPNNGVTPFSTFYGSCGSVTLTAYGENVSAIIRPKFLVWSFQGAITDSFDGSTLILADNFDNSTGATLSKRWDYRSISITGRSRDVTGSTCTVAPNATIAHYH